MLMPQFGMAELAYAGDGGTSGAESGGTEPAFDPYLTFSVSHLFEQGLLTYDESKLSITQLSDGGILCHVFSHR